MLPIPIGMFWIFAGPFLGLFVYFNLLRLHEREKFGDRTTRIMGFLVWVALFFLAGMFVTILSNGVYSTQKDIVTRTVAILPLSDADAFVTSSSLDNGETLYVFCVASQSGDGECTRYSVSSEKAEIHEYEEGKGLPAIEFHEFTTDCSAPSSWLAGFFVGCLKYTKELVWILIPEGSIFAEPNPIQPLDFDNKP